MQLFGGIKIWQESHLDQRCPETSVTPGDSIICNIIPNGTYDEVECTIRQEVKAIILIINNYRFNIKLKNQKFLKLRINICEIHISRHKRYRINVKILIICYDIFKFSKNYWTLKTQDLPFTFQNWFG